MKLMLCSNYHAHPLFKEISSNAAAAELGPVLNNLWDKQVMETYFEDFLKGATLPNDGGYVLHLEERASSSIESVFTRYGEEKEIRHIHVPLAYSPEDCLLYPDKVACIVLHGGNTFNISSYIHEKGWYEFIIDKVQNQNVPYIGYSAGAIMATPFVLSAMWADPLGANFLKDVNNFCGFGFVDFFVKPHDESYMVMPRYIRQFKDFSEIFGHKFYSIGEYGAIIINDDKISVFDVTDLDKVDI